MGIKLLSHALDTFTAVAFRRKHVWCLDDYSTESVLPVQRAQDHVGLPQVFTAREKETMARTQKVLTAKTEAGAGRKSDPGPRIRRPRSKKVVEYDSDSEEIAFGGSDADDDDQPMTDALQ